MIKRESRKGEGCGPGTEKERGERGKSKRTESQKMEGYAHIFSFMYIFICIDSLKNASLQSYNDPNICFTGLQNSSV